MPPDLASADLVASLVLQANTARRHGGWQHDAELALERACQCSRHLAVYGTLAPGESNHHVLAGCRGTWSACTVRGRKAQRSFPVFSYEPEGPAVAMQHFVSAQLPTFWRALNAFEGSDYCRILVVASEARALTVANLYEARQPV